MVSEGRDGDQEQCGKTEYDRSEKKDFCAVRGVRVNTPVVVRARGVSDDFLFGALYRACDRPS